MSYDEIEAGIKAGDVFALGESVRSEHLIAAATHETDPRKKAVLVKLADMELKSRHKYNPELPVFQPSI
jgi:hypothetical protein